MKRRTFEYDALVEGLRREPTFEIAEAIAKKDFPLKLPNRKWLTIFNSAELSQFRGIQEEMDNAAQARNKIDRDKNAVNKAAQYADVSTPDMTFVHEAANRERQMASSFDAHMKDVTRLHAQRMASQDLETKAELERLANLQAEADKKARMAETALAAFRDIQDEDRKRLGRLAERQGVTTNHIDQRVVNNTTTVDNTNHHNQLLQLVNAHGHNFAEFMSQQNMNQVEMTRLLNEHVRRTPAPVIHLIPPEGETPMDVEVFGGGGGGPPPPPEAGSVKVKKAAVTKKRDSRAIIVNRPGDSHQPPPAPPPAPTPIPVPTVPPGGAEMFDIGTPRAKGRSRSRSASRPAALPKKIAWTTAMVQDETRIPDSDPLPPPIIVASRARARKRDESIETIRYPSDEPPQVRAKAKARPTAQLAILDSSSSSDPPPPPSAPAAKAKSRPKPKAVARSIFRSPSTGPPGEDEGEGILPSAESAEKTGASLSKVIKTKVKEKTDKPAAKARGRPRKTPEGTSVRKPVVKFVRIASGPAKEIGVKPRGRPKGAFGKAKRERLEKAALESSSLA
jgi:hypothetical protein